MPIQTTYSNARNKLASLLSRVIDEQEIVVINRRGHEDVALISAAELSSLTETAHLLRSPKNAQRLLKALHRAQAQTEKSGTLEDLREETGVEKRKKKP
jgi:antitoxin YefM